MPRRRPGSGAGTLDVIQVSELLGCSTAVVYHLCERGKLPHHRDLHNAIRFECKLLGRVLRKLRLPNP